MGPAFSSPPSSSPPPPPPPPGSLRDLLRRASHSAAGAAASGAGLPGSAGHEPPSRRLRALTPLMQNVQQRGTACATVDVKSGRMRTWAEVGDRVAKLAGGMRLGMGVTEGARVAVLSFNSDLYFEVMLACAYAGAISVPLNFRLSPVELAHCLNDSGASVLFVDESWAKDLVPKVRELLVKGQVAKFVLLGAGDAVEHLGEGAISSEDVIVSVNSSLTTGSPSLRGGDDILSIFYTGGTTGKAKGVCLTHGNVMSNAFGTLVFQADYRSDTVLLHSAPMFHLADAQHVWIGTLAGCQHVFMEKFVPPEVFPLVDKYKVTKFVLVPMMIQMVLNQKDVEEQVKGFKERPMELMYGGSPMSQAMMQALIKLLPRLRLMQGFGMTETAPAISLLGHEDHFNNKMHTVGRPVAYAEVIIADENDKEVPKGQFGEILVRGPQVMRGYWNQPELTAETLKGGWMHTGDGGFMDEDGFIVLCDRIKYMIKSGGENVFSAEVENCLAGMPGVAMCCVLGAPDPTYGEIVVAVLVPKSKGEDISLDQVKAFCKEKQLAGYKTPKRVIMRESLPMSGPGKVLKNELKAQLGLQVQVQAGSSGKGAGERKTAYA